MSDQLAAVRAMLHDAPIARLATVTASGRAALAPFWFFFDGQLIFIDTAANVTVRNIRREPRVALLVDFGRAYADLHGAQIHGTAAVYEPEDAPHWVLRGIQGYIDKYAVHEHERTGTGDVHRLHRPARAYVVVTPQRVHWFSVGGYFQGALSWTG